MTTPMRLYRILREALAHFSSDEAKEWLAELTGLERIQGSRDLETAASYVAGEASRIGLQNLEVRASPADGREQWWRFRAPVSWSPIHAELIDLESGRLLTSYPVTRCSLAVRSRPTSPDGLVASTCVYSPDASGNALAGHLVLIPRGIELTVALARLERAGAAGFVTDTVSFDDPVTGETAIGRIELPPDTVLFGFSVAPRTMDELTRESRHLKARIEADCAPSRTIPFVTAKMPGACPDEILLMAHLCHSAPAANDNASGVAALLGIGKLISESCFERRLSIGYLWGGEFVGSAAYLHARKSRPGGSLKFAVNLDMVGENQDLYQSTLILERPPLHAPSPLPALMEACAKTLQGDASRRWAAAPFAGFSDHALFADPVLRCSAVQLGHRPDRFNHTSLDSMDKVDFDQLGRSVAISAASVIYLASLGPSDIEDCSNLIVEWTRERLRAAACRPIEGDRADLISPFTTRHRPYYLSAIAEHGVQSIASLCDLAGVPFDAVASRKRIAAYLENLVEPELPARHPVIRKFEGPLNLRAVMDDLGPHSWLQRAFRQDKSAWSICQALAYSIDGQRDSIAVALSAAMTLERPIATSFCHAFLDCVA